ncbi:hypothetical protein Tco_1346759 [Tanacetum coccineum]
MSNTNNIMQTQTSNALHKAIMKACSKDHPPMLAPGNYNPPYKFKWNEKTVPVLEGSSETTIEGYMENYKNVSQDIRDQLNDEAEVEFRKFTSRDGESLESYYSRSQPAATKNRGKEIINSPPPTYNQEPTMVAKDDEMSKEKEIDKLMALILISFKKIYKPTNNNLRTSSNTSRANQNNNPRINRGTGYDNQRVVNVVGARENVADWRDDTDDEPADQELEAHYLYMTQIQEVTPDVADNFRPIFDAEPLQMVASLAAPALITKAKVAQN